jgi:hypothetical protein
MTCTNVLHDCAVQVVPPTWPQGSRYSAQWGVPTTTAGGEPTTLPSAWLLTKYPEGRAGRFMVPEWAPPVQAGALYGEDYGHAQEQEKTRAVMEREAKREAQQRRAQAGLSGHHQQQQQQQQPPPQQQQQPAQQPSSSRPAPTGERNSSQPAADPCGYAATTPAVSIPAALDPAGMLPGPGYT